MRGHELQRRRDLPPQEADYHRAGHPRSGDAYSSLQLGPLERLAPPIISLRWRRITFIESAWDRFQMAQEINELYASGADGLFVTLKEMGIVPERCHFSGYTGPCTFTQRGPTVFTQTGPAVFAKSGPLAFTQRGPRQHL